MAEVAGRHRAVLEARRQPRLRPAFLGVGWSPRVERRPRKGERCERCGGAPGAPSPRLSGDWFCLACLGVADGVEARVAASATPPPAAGREDRAPAARLSAAERRVVGSNIHGKIWLAMLDAEHAGDRGRASRYRLWLALYRDRLVDAGELERRFSGEAP